MKLHEICSIQSGGTPSRGEKEYWENGSIPWVKISDFRGKLLKETEESITELGLNCSSAKVFPKGTILYSIFATLGEVSILNIDAATNQAIAGITITDESVDVNYLYYFLISLKEQVNRIGRGVAQNNINLSILRNIEVPLPDHSTQKNISFTLDRVDYVIDLYHQQLEKMDELVKSRFIEMFGDMADPKCTHPKCKLSEACKDSDDIKCGPFGTQLSKDEYQQSGVAVWEIPQVNSNFNEVPTHFVTNEKAEQLKAYSLKPGDIAMSRKGNVGRCGLFPDGYAEGIIHSDVLRIRADKKRVNPCFLMYQLHYSGDVQRQIEMVSSGAIMAGINVTKLKSIEVYVPDFKLQEQFATFVQATDKSKLAVQKSLDELEILKKSLMQKYFG